MSLFLTLLKTLSLMEQILDAPASAQRNIQYAGFWIRVAASILDGLILQFGLAIFMGLFAVGLDMFQPDSPAASVLLFIILVAVYVCYFAGMESSSTQATLGKMAVGIKVGNHDGERISFGHALGRFFAKFISTITFYIGYMMAGWDAKNQALHDKIANTYVFYKQR
jgi:uncharacterized RDD family membrane protein YckC